MFTAQVEICFVSICMTSALCASMRDGGVGRGGAQSRGSIGGGIEVGGGAGGGHSAGVAASDRHCSCVGRRAGWCE